MLSINRSYLNGSARWGTVNVPKYIVVHYTGNKNADTAVNNVIYMNRIGENAGGSAHYYVDNTSIYQLLEDNWDSWSVGDDNGYGRFAFGINNNNQISIEMCCTSGNYRVSDKTQENCAELVAHLLKKHGLGLDRIRRHYDASRKSCPAQFCPYNTYYPYNDGESNWAKFKQKVAKYYNGAEEKEVKKLNNKYNGKYMNMGDWCPRWRLFDIYSDELLGEINPQSNKGLSYEILVCLEDTDKQKKFIIKTGYIGLVYVLHWEDGNSSITDEPKYVKNTDADLSKLEKEIKEKDKQIAELQAKILNAKKELEK